MPGLQGEFRRGFDRGYMNLHGYECSPKDRACVGGLIAQYDLVWVLNSRTPNLPQRSSWSRSHLAIAALHSTYVRTMAQYGQSLVACLKARLQQRHMHQRELRFRDRFVTLSVGSAEDKAYVDGDDRVLDIPNGFDRPTVPPVRNINPNEPRIDFSGLYSCAPNLDSVDWFFAECWSAIRQAVPGIRSGAIVRWGLYAQLWLLRNVSSRDAIACANGTPKSVTKGHRAKPPSARIPPRPFPRPRRAGNPPAARRVPRWEPLPLVAAGPVLAPPNTSE
jgi:hypothetical protein